MSTPVLGLSLHFVEVSIEDWSCCLTDEYVFIRNCQAAFQSGFTVTPSHQPRVKALGLHILTNIWLSVFLILAEILSLLAAVSTYEA